MGFISRLLGRKEVIAQGVRLRQAAHQERAQAVNKSLAKVSRALKPYEWQGSKIERFIQKRMVGTSQAAQLRKRKEWVRARRIGARAVGIAYSRMPGATVPKEVEGLGSKKGGIAKGYAHPGRPRATYKHVIPNVGPVSVYEWRKWDRRQQALRRILAQQQITQGQPIQYQQMQPQQLPQQIVYPQQQAYPIQQPIQPPKRVTFLQDDFNILKAPNPWKGELRNVGQNTPIDANRVARPITNPQGDQYTEIDPISGRPILKNRVRERWLS